MATATTPALNVTVSYRGAQHKLALLPDTLLSALELELEQLTGVPSSLQKLIYKGKKAGSNEDTESVTLSEAGIKDGMKIQMLGTTTKELDGMKGVEDEQRQRERILRERALKPQVKPRSTGPNGNSIASISTLNASALTSQYRFHDIAPLPHLPNPSLAKEILEKLATDPSIRHVMHKHKFSVGLLTELAPHENPELLGLNVNAGQSIKLRIRTDKYDGFRLYKDIRRVLCHELAHNVWGDHDENFKELNSKLNREVLEYEKAALAGAHTLSGAPSFSPSTWGPAISEQEAEARSYVLGGSSSSSSSSIFSEEDSAEDRRQRVLAATLNRLKKEEELEHSCGTRRTIN